MGLSTSHIPYNRPCDIEKQLEHQGKRNKEKFFRLQPWAVDLALHSARTTPLEL